MKAIKVVVSRGLTINLGNYESERIDLSAEIELSPGETAEQAFDAGWKLVTEQLELRVGDKKQDYAF